MVYHSLEGREVSLERHVHCEKLGWRISEHISLRKVSMVSSIFLFRVFICRHGRTGSDVNGVSYRGGTQHGLKVTLKSTEKMPQRLMNLAHRLWKLNLFLGIQTHCFEFFIIRCFLLIQHSLPRLFWLFSLSINNQRQSWVFFPPN